MEGAETLFWLEVESGNSSIERLQQKTIQRINQALLFARRCPARLIFTILGPPWVLRGLISTFGEIPPDLSILLGDWMAFGSLPNSRWGEFASRR
jgi:hypothetical protein